MTNMTDILYKVNSELSRAQSTYYWLLISILASITWIVYLTYYNSRVCGLILTLCLNKFQKYGHIRFGSFSISVLSGKIMFRDVHWITEDYSVRIKFGYLIFRWWQPLTKKEYHEDLSHSYTRLTTYFENFEFHIYNYSSNFSKLEKVFGLDENIIPPSKSATPSKLSPKVSKVELNKAKWQWRDLIPVIKIDINASRIIFGNYLMPQSLVLSAREMHLVYTTKPASTPFDLFMHVVKCKTDNFKVMLVPSPKYSGKADEPPRCMGEGFAVVQSNDVEFYYYQDEPGLVPYEPESVYLANGDVVSIRTWPCWGMDVKCGKNTDFSYGPWCERQREFLWKFFFPPDFQPMKPETLPNPGQLRIVKNFDFKMSMQNDITIDLLFTKQKETQAIHMNCKQGSYLEFTVPMFLEEAGYTFTMTGQLLHVDSSTSLKFRSLVECETLQFSVSAKYMSNWNDLQDLTYDFTACKATGYLIYNHKTFFSELSEDWSSKARPDIYSFIPYTVKVNLILKEFEIITLTNQWNWIDCFGTSAENSHIAISGDTFDMSLTVPFTDFMPNTVDVKLFIRGESAEALLYLPETNTNRQLLIGLSENLNVLSRDGGIEEQGKAKNEKKWSRVCKKIDGWVEVVSSPIVAVSLVYTYHPIPPLTKESPFLTPEEIDSEEAVLVPFKLIPLRPLRSQLPQKKKGKGSPSTKLFSDDDGDVNLSNMEPDIISLEIEVGPSVAYLYGSLVRNFLHLKENYFGDYQKFSDFEKNIETAQPTATMEMATPSGPIDPRIYRPFSLHFHLTLHDVQGHLVKNCSKEGEPCPSIYMERMVFEMDKRFHETKLQVFFSPILLVCRDTVKRPNHQSHLENGHLTLSALQIRGNAMFSHQGLPLSSETLEYAWLIEITVGDLVGRMTSVQLQSVVEFLQTFVCMFEDKENELVCPNVYPMCQHMVPQNLCTKSGGGVLQPCPTVSDLKYEFLRLSIDCVDFYLVESGTALCLQIYPVRLSNCNLFNKSTMMGITILLPTVSLKHYALSNATVKSSAKDDATARLWIESGGFNFGPLNIDLSKTLSSIQHLYAQQEFLRYHDHKFQRLNFLWNVDKCGCVGGCKFFGNNRNGSTFFDPSPDDFSNNLNVALTYICKSDNQEEAFGFGQSILRNRQLIFYQPVLEASKYFKEIFKNTSHVIQADHEISETAAHSEVVKSGTTGSTVTLDKSIRSRTSRDSVSSKTGLLSSGSNVAQANIKPLKADDVLTDSLGSLQLGTTSESSRINLSHASNNEKFQSVDFPINQKIKTTTKVSTQDTDKAQPLRRLSLVETPSAQKWQSEKELSQMIIDGISNFEYGSLSIQETLESSKGSIYEVAPQSLDEKERSDASLDSFVSAVSLSPDPVLDQTHAPLKVKWDETSSLTRQASRAVGRQSRDLPQVAGDKLQAHPRKAPPTSLEIKSTSAKIQPKKKSLTMECYKCYLSQMQCLNWVALAPVSSINRGLRMQGLTRMRDGESLENMVPHFVYYSKGFDCTTKLYKTAANKSDDENSDEVKTSARPSGHFVGLFSDEPSPHDPAGVGAEKSEFQVNDWIVVVRFKESINAMFSPLMLDSLNNYIEASTPILSQMHPSSIVDMLNIKCLNSVNEQGDKTTSPSCFSIWSDPSSTSTTIDKLESEKFHVLIDFPQVNISMLQACIVEDRPHAHNVEKMHEPTSVSLFIMCIDSIRIEMLSRAEIKSTSTLLMSNSVTPKNKKSQPADSQDMHSLLISNLGNKLGVGKKKNQDNARLQKMLGQSNNSIIKCKSFSEVKKKSFIAKVNMSRVHFQLRRSRSLSNTPDPLSLTAIPSSSSKVFFSFNDNKATESNPYDLNSSPYSWNVYREKNYHHSKSHDASKKIDHELSDSPIETIIGLLMFECGFENISFSAGGRFGYVQKETKQNSQEGEECLVNAPVEGHTLSSPELQPDDPMMQTGAAKNASCFCTSRTFAKSYREKAETSSNKQKVEAAKVDGRASAKHADSMRHAESAKSNVSTGPAEDKTDSTVLDGRHETDEPAKENEVKETLKGDASSFGLEIKTLWFNFAAPPASSKEMKFLANKHDWNLLSTATPSINAWINSCHKITTGAKNMYDKFNRRMSSVMACLMTDALEVQGIHLMPKSKYNKTTWESKFLQDDPSCQLLTVMRKYIHQVGADAIEASLAEDTIPQSLTIRNGLLVLTRQWKNVLYLPMFDENSFKAKKKVTVTFAVPVFQNEENEGAGNTSKHACQAEEVELNLDNMDIIDESTSLLKAEGGSVMRVRSSEDSESRFQHHSQQHDRDTSYQLYSQKPMFLEPTSPLKKVVENDVSNLTLNSGYSSDHVIPLLSSSADFEHPSSILYLPASKSKVQHREDLQKWMNKQQEYLINHSMNAPLNKEETASTDVHKKRDVHGVSGENASKSDTGKDGSVAMHKVLASPTFQLVDAQVLFKPLLKSLGLHFEPVRMSAIMKKFGGELSMLANLKEIRVEIVDSESTIKAKLLKKRPVVRMSMRARPAFLCKHFSVTLSMKDMLDVETITGNRKARFVDPADADADREPVYLKTVQLFKDTIEQIEAKPATTKINFSVTSQSVTQHVNMSLLRLVHQFVTMVEDVAQTKSDLDKTLPSLKAPTEVISGALLDQKLKSQEQTPTSDKQTASKGAKRPNIINMPTNSPLTVDELNELELNIETRQYNGKEPLDEGIPSPFKLFKVNGEPVVIETMDSASPTVQQKTIFDEIKATTPKCWKNLYHLLNLYNSMPDVMQTFSRSQLSVIEEDDRTLTSKAKKKRFPSLRPKPMQSSFFAQNIVVRERIPLIVFGTVHIKAINISAVLSGLKLHAELQSCQASFTHGEKIKGIAKKKSTESSVSLSVDLTTVTLLEGFQPSLQQIVVQVKVSRSNGIFSSFLKKSSENSVCLLSGGLIAINIPQHPVALHTMVVHSSKRLSNTLQEFIKLPGKNKSLDALDTPLSSSRQGSNYSTFSNAPHQSFSSTAMPGMFSNANAGIFAEPSSSYDTPVDHATIPKAPKKVRSKPIVIHFRARIKGLIIGASLLPSLKSQYQIGEVTSVGVAGTKSKFTIHLLKHNLSFSSKVNVPSNIPTSASIALPPIHVEAEYLLQQQTPEDMSSNNQNTFTDGMVLREGNYLKATAEVGAFEHVLTTDLLNHLVFVQKVFMKEVNEVVQKVSGSDQPVFLWSDTLTAPTERRTPLLYSFLFRLKSLQITATTPTNNAVRLETGKIEFELSNRVRRMESTKKSAARDNNMFETRVPKVFFQVKVDLNLALGTLIKNPMFEEAEAEFPHLASFATSITLRNALQDEIIAGASMDQEALLITLKRPIIFVLPSAFDKAILVWLNYRNAYEYWMEQRMALNKEIQMATQQVLTKIPPLTEGSLGILFLQMTVDDLGICLPMNPLTQKGFTVNREDSGFCGAMVLTLENAQISACSYGSFVCKGKFTGFCLRFAEDFEVSWDDWKPEKSYEFVMNALVVPNGTFEMCSRTINLRPVTDERKNPPPFMRASSNQSQSNNAKWILNILWQMKGIDIHLDTNIGKRLNMVWNTLTSLAGETQLDDAALTNVQDVPTRVEQVARKQSAILQDDLPEFVFDLTLDSKTRARLIENEMNEQAKVVQDLKMLRASRNTIEEEERKLQGLQAALFNDFRQDIIKRFRYHSTSKKAPESKHSSLTLSDHSHSRSTSMAGIKLQEDTNIKEVIKPKNVQPRRVLESQSLTLKVTPSHLRTHSFDVSQLHSKTADDILDGPRPNLTLPIEEEQLNTQPPQAPTIHSTQSIGKAPLPEVIFEDDFKLLEFSDEDFDYEDFMDSHESKDIDLSGRDKLPKTTKQIVEPAIDFELDVRAEIDSGKCVLHPKESKVEQTAEYDISLFSKRTKSSPKLFDKKRSAKKQADYFITQANRITMVPNNNTVFFIPGVEVKLHYNSRTLTTADDNQPEKTKKLLGIKRANLYAWFSIQELPEEMLISTSLLDFLEQAIEPIPIEPLKKASFKLNAVHSQMSQSLGSFGSSFASSNVQPYTSFPVDVVVYIRVQPSMVRFTCLPVSRVECLLRVPSLDIVFSTKKVDNYIAESVFPKKDRQTLLALDVAQGGGLSVSVCMNDFSLYIFHPYGGGQRKTSGITLGSIQSKVTLAKPTSVIEARKDSLSLNVEFIKVNISRSRLGVPPPASKTEHMKHQQTSSNVVQFSLVCDIGSASFKYDMRRLLEILALPKAWYRRTLARRLFLGEEMAVFDSDSGSDDDFMTYDISQFSSESSITDNMDDYKSKILQSASRMPSLERLFLDYPPDKAVQIGGTSFSHHPMRNYPPPSTKTISSWETLVLVTVNLPQLDVMVNMSNAMGNTVWTTKGLQCQGKLKIDSAGYRNVNLCAGLKTSKLEAKGGIIGGLVEIQNLHAQTFVKEVPGKEPEHKVQASLHTLETRLDYMGSAILIGRISDLMVQLNDEWQLQPIPTEAQKYPSMPRSVLVLIHGKLVWDKLHLMISRSTTPDLLKMVHKLEEFFSQQLMSGKRVLSTFGAGPVTAKPKSKIKEETSANSWLLEVNLHRYWQHVLEKLVGGKLSVFPALLSNKGTVVGGSMNLVGKNISLACFHGMNFRSKFWALFTMDEPYIMFATEAADIEKEENEKMTQVIQNLTFQLRHNAMDMSGKRRMAMVYKLSRGHYMPPPFTSVQEWFHYAFATNDIKDLDKFPTTSKATPETPAVIEVPKKHAPRRMAEYSHDTEIIFILPSFQMHLKTIQLQQGKPPLEEDKMPVVECSFVTEFDDHIFVAMDAEAVLFLHDLITNYVKEKDKLDKMPKSPEMEKQKTAENTSAALKKDVREFDCKTWHLEPTVRLLSWAGKEIDPVGVDYILQKLGFQHARLTIPKWMQRGFMDPLDKILSVLLSRLITALQETS